MSSSGPRTERESYATSCTDERLAHRRVRKSDQIVTLSNELFAEWEREWKCCRQTCLHSSRPSDNDQPRLKLKLACLNANQSTLVASPPPYIIAHALLINIDAFNRFLQSYAPESLSSHIHLQSASQHDHSHPTRTVYTRRTRHSLPFRSRVTTSSGDPSSWRTNPSELAL